MKTNYLEEAKLLFPDAVSNYEALLRLENHVHQLIMSLKDTSSNAFRKLERKFLEIREEKRNTEVKYYQKQIV